VNHVVDSGRRRARRAEAINGLGEVLEQLDEPRLVVGSDEGAVGLALTLRTYVGIVATQGDETLVARTRAR
jgi:hypothetical protein